MKKILIIACLALSSGFVYGQAIGIMAGLNFAQGTFDDPTVDDTIDGITGIRIGPVVQLPLGVIFQLHTGAIYSQQGFELPDREFTLDYIDVPINLAAAFGLGGIKGFVKAGPVLGIGIGGKETDAMGETDVKFGSGDDELKLLDVGGSFAAGVMLGTLQIEAGYDLTLNELANGDTSYKNKMLHVSLAFVLGGN